MRISGFSIAPSRNIPAIKGYKWLDFRRYPASVVRIFEITPRSPATLGQMNNFLAFYEAHAISPVNQDISDLGYHHFRREMLYRRLGIPPQAIRGSTVLEIGPGSGHNSIVTGRFQPARYVLLEPNSTGRKLLAKNLARHGLSGENIVIHPWLLEAWPDDATFDFVFCEGLIPGLENKENFLLHVDRRVAPGGTLLVTCLDAISVLFETIRRLITLQIDDPQAPMPQRAALLVQAFGSHLATLRGMSRNVEDWVLDNLLSPAAFNANDLFSIGDALTFFGDRYYFGQTSPQFLSDYTWYKEVAPTPLEFNRRYLDDFDCKHHNLLHYRIATTDRSTADNATLRALAVQLSCMAQARSTDSAIIAGALRELRANTMDMVAPASNENASIAQALEEAATLFEHRDFAINGIADRYPAFRSAFGRGQQYLSLVKGL